MIGLAVLCWTAVLVAWCWAGCSRHHRSRITDRRLRAFMDADDYYQGDMP